MNRLPLLLVFGTAAACWGDTLTLKNGDVVEGTFLGGTARNLRMEVDGRILSYDISLVNGLQFAGAGNSQAPPPPPQPPFAPPPGNNPPRASSSDDNGPVLRRPPQPGEGNGRVLRAEDNPPPPSNYPPEQQGVELPQGTTLTVRMIDAVDSEIARLGDTFRASLDEPVMMNGQSVLPRGADVVAKLVDDQKSGKIAGKAVLKIALVSIKVNDRMVEVTTQDVVRESGSRGARSGKVIGGTAALGAIIGGIVGGGKGAAIGAGSGAAVGTGAQEITKGQQVKIPSETRLVFTLASSVRL